MYLDPSQKHGFIEYSIDRRNKNGYCYLTSGILSKTFDYMINHKLQTNEKGYCWLDNTKDKDWRTLGFVDYIMTSNDEFVDQLFHHVYCEAEYFARVEKETVVLYHGIKAYNFIIGC